MASRSLGTLTLDLLVKLGGFTQGMSQAERETANRARQMEKTLGKLRKSFTGLFAGLTVGLLVRSIVTATAEAEKALSLLDNAVKASGGSAGRTTEQLAGMATELQKVTTYSDEAVMGAEQLLLRFQSIQGINFDRALNSSLDLSAALGTDLSSAAQLVGKALENPIKGMNQLARSGVVLAEDQKELIKRLVETGRQAEAQGILLDELEKRYGGAAEAARNNFGGALEGLKNAFGDLLEGKGGVPQLTEEINNLTKQLQDPATVQGINNITTAIARLLGVVVEGVSEFGSFGEVIARMAASATGGLTEFDRLQGEIMDLDRAINNSFMGRPLKFITKSTEELKAMRAEVELQIKALEEASGLVSSKGDGAAASGGAPIIPPPSEEFLDLEAKLKEQIALFGKVGEAAKIAYSIQSGGLDELTKAEQDQVLALARRLDTLTKSAEVAKEAAAAAKEQEQEQRALTDSFLSAEASLLRQIVLTADATELEQMRYEINSGGLQKITQGQKEWLESLAKQVDADNALIKAEEERQKIMEEGQALFESMRTPMEEYQATIAHLNDLLAAGAIQHDTYGRAVVKAQKDLEEATKKSNDFLLEAARGTQDILADTLFGAMQGKIDNIETAFVKMISNLVAQALAARLTEKLFGDISGKGPSGGGLIDMGLDWLGGLFGGPRASGGSAQSGTLFRVNEYGTEALSIPGRADYLMTGRQGGEVIPANRAGRSVASMTQNIIVRGRVDQRTARQLELDASRRQRTATARLS